MRQATYMQVRPLRIPAASAGFALQLMLVAAPATADDPILRPVQSAWSDELFDDESAYANLVRMTLRCDRKACARPESVRAVFLPSFDPEWIVWSGSGDDGFEVCSAVASSNLYYFLQEGQSDSGKKPNGQLSCARIAKKAFHAIRDAWLFALLNTRFAPPDRSPARYITTDGESMRFMTWGEGIGPLEAMASNPPRESQAGRMFALATQLYQKSQRPDQVTDSDLIKSASSVKAPLK
jgi:hypothetical protein